MATKLGSDVGYRSGIYNGYKVIGTQTLGLRGLVLWLKFNEGSGNIAYDSSFYNNHGTIYGATWTDGKFGKALSFDGVDDYVEIPDFSGVNDQITITAWVFLPTKDQPTNYPPILEKFENWGNRIWLNLITTSEKVHLGYALDGQDWRFISTSIDYNRWVFVAGVVNGRKMKIYIDGLLKIEGQHEYDFDWASINAPIRMGKGLDKRILNGTIDEVRIFNRALSENEIKMLYYNRIGAVPSKTI